MSVRRENSINASIMDEARDLPVDEAFSELAGILAVIRRRREKDGSVSVTTPRRHTTRRILKLLKSIRDRRYDGSVIVDKKRFVVRIALRDDLFDSLISSPIENCWNWIRGTFIAVGAIVLPRTGYYMYWRVSDPGGTADRIRDILGDVGIETRARSNGVALEVTVRDQQDISTFLAKIGTVRGALALEEIAMMRSIKGNASKIVNCDSSNIDKTISAARSQLEIISALRTSGILETLPPQIAELAALRADNPEASLRELGQMLSRPISKSAVEYRWKKMEELVSGSLRK